MLIKLIAWEIGRANLLDGITGNETKTNWMQEKLEGKVDASGCPFLSLFDYSYRRYKQQMER